MKVFMSALLITLSMLFTQCDTIKNIPTNTSGTVFSLNGNWQLSKTNDNKALEGTVVRVVPGFSSATIKTISNNSYCLRELDVVWKGIANKEGGSFTIDNLVDACNSSAVYRPGTITVINTDEIRIASRTASGAELLQTWKRVDTQ